MLLVNNAQTLDACMAVEQTTHKHGMAKRQTCGRSGTSDETLTFLLTCPFPSHTSQTLSDGGYDSHADSKTA